MSTSHFRCIYLVVALAVFAGVIVVPPLHAQADYSTATLKGTLYDPTDAVIGGVTITVINPETGVARVVKTGEDGAYIVPALTPGTYIVEAEVAGFAKSITRGIVLSVGQVADFNIHLQIGAVSDVIEVTTAAPLIEVEKTQQANTVNETAVQNIPNLNRNFTESVFTLPGVSSSDAPRAQMPGFTGFLTSGFSVGGSNGRNNLVTIDGGENEYGSGQLRTPNVPVDSVQEFQVNRSSFGAEFGFTAGTAINVVTKSGTNALHGGVHAFFRDEDTDAQNYFATSKAFEQNFVSGLSLGGPIIKDKLFIFGSYEYIHQNTPEFRSYGTSPEALGLSSDQATYLGLLSNSGDPTLKAIAAGLAPALNPQNFPATQELLGPNTGVFDDYKKYNDGVIRMDYMPDSNDSLTTRLSVMRHNESRIWPYPTQSPSDSNVLFWNDYAILQSWTHTLSPTVINQLRVQAVPHDGADDYPDKPNSAYLDMGALGNFDGDHYLPYKVQERRFQFEDSVSWTKGNHALKFGVSYRPVDYNVTNQLWTSGEFDFFDGAIPLIALVPTAAQPLLGAFNVQHGYPATGNPATNLSALQSFDLGLPVDFRQAFGNANWSSWANYVGAYAQDAWKLSPRLRIEYGGRIDYDAEPAPVPHGVYFSPRLGIAWDATGDQKTVIRAGSGVFVSPVYFQIPYLTNLLNDSGKYLSQVTAALPGVFPGVEGNAAALWQIGVAEGKLPFGSLNAADLAALPAADGGPIVPGPGQAGRVVFDLAPNYKNNYTVQASFSIDRQLSRNLSLEVGYNYYRSVHIPLDQETNVRPTGVVDPFIGPIYTQINPNIIQNDTYSSIGNSTYNGLTASLSRRFSNGLQFQANYTFSKAIDDATDFNSNFTAFRPTDL
ncbi:MAG: carboxypeptidase regulatory-like domain-containing protein, partial [Bryobacteraceae bacterium]